MSQSVSVALRQAARRLAAAGVDTPRLDAEVLLADLLGLDRLHLYTQADRLLTPGEQAAYEQRVQARARRQPVAQIVGYKEFYGYRFTVRPGVLVPRPETEKVVEEALARWDEMERPPGRRWHIVDVGCGSGVIGLTLVLLRPDTELIAIDQSPAACALTAENALRLGVGERVRVVQGDLLSPLLPAGDPPPASSLSGISSIDLVVCNPPYVPLPDWDELAPEIRHWEPKMAVAAGGDGLAVYRLLLPQAIRVLRAGGVCVVEIGDGQAEAVGQLGRAVGFTRERVGYDWAGRQRVVSWIAPATRKDARVD
ncbi:MAG: peptide chain release factor N(5)-glutamine methyltransferase [Limnochordaceae bacterium]|nr:peptide chain release factor N(5)-glutamine methyltransferase [Limnochordaceae bacterium]